MNKKFLLVFASSLLAMSLASCGGKGGNGGDDPSGGGGDGGDDTPATAETEFAKIVENASANKDRIVSGTYGYDTNTKWGSEQVTGVFNYGVNDNGLMYSYTSNSHAAYGDEVYDSGVEYYVFHDENGEVASYLYSINGEEKEFAIGYLEEDAFDGIDFSWFTFNPDSESDFAIGGEGLAEALVGLVNDNSNKDAVFALEEAGKISFSSGYISSDWSGEDVYSYFDGSVSYDPETYFVTGVEARVFELDAEDVVADEEEGTFTTEVDFSSVTPNRTNSYTAVAGTRTALDFEYTSFDVFYFDSFKVGYGGTTIENGDTVVATVGDYATAGFYIDTFSPETALPEFESFTITVSQDGEELDGYNSFLSYTQEFSFGSITEEGTYDVSIKSKKGCEVNFTVEATSPSLTGFYLDYWYYDEEWEDWCSSYESKTDLYVGETYAYEVVAEPSGCDNSYEVTVDDESVVIGTQPIDTWDGTIELFTVTPSKVGEFVVTVTSTVNPEVVATLEITVEERPAE